MGCPIGEIELYYEDGKRYKCPYVLHHFKDCSLSLTDKGFKCCLRYPGGNTVHWKCVRITLGGNIAQRYLKAGELSEFVIDRFKLIFFKKQILEEVEKVRADAKVA